MKYIPFIVITLISGILISIFTLSSNNIVFAQTNSTTSGNALTYESPFILFTQVWGGDIPVTQTFLYDSYSNMSIAVFGGNVTVNHPLPEQMAEIRGDIQQSGIQSIKSDVGTCNNTQICYLLHTVAPMGLTGQSETYSIAWNSNSSQTEYVKLNDIISKVQMFGH